MLHFLEPTILYTVQGPSSIRKYGSLTFTFPAEKSTFRPEKLTSRLKKSAFKLKPYQYGAHTFYKNSAPVLYKNVLEFDAMQARYNRANSLGGKCEDEEIRGLSSISYIY
jgi:hypothetical protein